MIVAASPALPAVAIIACVLLPSHPIASEIDPRVDNGVHFYGKKYCNCRKVDAADIEITAQGATVFPGTPRQEAYTCVMPSPDGRTSYRCLGVEDDILLYDGRCLLTGPHKGA